MVRALVLVTLFSQGIVESQEVMIFFIWHCRSLHWLVLSCHW